MNILEEIAAKTTERIRKEKEADSDKYHDPAAPLPWQRRWQQSRKSPSGCTEP